MNKLLAFCLSLILPALSLNAEMTLSIIKPDAVAANHVGDIIARYEKGGLKVAGVKMVKMTKPEAMQFYSAHKDKPYYQGLVNMMNSGPVVVLALEGDNAIARTREIMGATDPAKALTGTIRRDFAVSIQSNAVHGSDAAETAKRELAFFFKPEEIYRRGS